MTGPRYDARIAAVREIRLKTPGNMVRVRPIAGLLVVAVALGGVAATGARGAGAESDVRESILRYLDRVQYVQPGRGVGPVVIGMPLAEVVSLWGEPTSVVSESAPDERVALRYETGLGARVEVSGERTVKEIDVEGDLGFTTREGVRFGMPRHQVILIYGEPGGGADELRYARKGIEFGLRQGQVFRMRVFKPEPA